MPSARAVEVTDLRRIPGGASRETWSFDATFEDGHGPRRGGYILRRDPDASLLVTERDREFRVYRALGGSPVPVPRALWLEADPAWLDRPFFVMERIDGGWTAPHVLIDPRFDRIRPAVAARKVEILAEIHRFDWRAGGLECLGVPESLAGCAPRELQHWTAVAGREALEPQPVLDAALSWLGAHLPPPAERIALVHGDYRTGNFIFDRRGAIRAVLDWEMAHLGDPIEDLAWACQKSWQFRDGLAGGLMSRAEVCRRYEAASGMRVDPTAFHWWEVFANVKLAAIYLTGARSFAERRTGEIMMAIVGRMLPPIEVELCALLAGG